MKKHIIIILLSFAVTMFANGQIRVSYSIGYGDYKMEDMHKLLDTSLSLVQEELPSGVRITDKFPGYVTHNMDVAYHFKRHEFGVKGSYMTTGGKIAYSDYSGKYYENLTLNGYRIGALYRFHFLESKVGNLPISLYGELSPAITFTSLKYKAQLTLPDYEVDETNPQDNVSTDETGYSIQPLLGAQLFVTRNLFITVSGGYDFEFGSKLSTTNDMFRVDWSGFRVNGGVGVSF